MAETLVGSKTLLDIRDLKMYFPLTRGIILQRVVGYVRAVDSISFAIEQGQTLGLVGESGSGKTTIGRTIIRLYKPTEGQIIFDNQDLAQMNGEDLRQIRRRVQMVFQDPFASLNPRFTIGSLIAEPMHIYNIGSSSEIREKTVELLRVVGLRSDYIDRYPHEFSGGQRQRIAVARALSINPEFIVLDEPVSALDVSVRAQVLNLLQQLQNQFNLIHRLRNADGVLFYQVIYPVQSTFLLDVAFILVVPWRSRFAVRWNLPLNARKVVSITRPATSLRKLPLQLLRGSDEIYTTFRWTDTDIASFTSGGRHCYLSDSRPL